MFDVAFVLDIIACSVVADQRSYADNLGSGKREAPGGKGTVDLIG